MRSTIKLLSALLFAIALLAAVVTTAGCDEDNIWYSASNTDGQYLLMGLLLQKGDVYAVSITVEGLTTNESWAGLEITIGGKRYTLDSTSSLTFNIRTLLELITDVVVTSSPAGYSCTSASELTDKQLAINISCNVN